MVQFFFVRETAKILIHTLPPLLKYKSTKHQYFHISWYIRLFILKEILGSFKD